MGEVVDKFLNKFLESLDYIKQFLQILPSGRYMWFITGNFQFGYSASFPIKMTKSEQLALHNKKANNIFCGTNMATELPFKIHLHCHCKAERHIYK